MIIKLQMLFFFMLELIHVSHIFAASVPHLRINMNRDTTANDLILRHRSNWMQNEKAGAGYIKYRQAIPMEMRRFYDKTIGGRPCPDTPRTDLANNEWYRKAEQWKNDVSQWNTFQPRQTTTNTHSMVHGSGQQSISANQHTDPNSNPKQRTQNQCTQPKIQLSQSRESELQAENQLQSGTSSLQEDRRMRQILIGKNTDGYIRYRAAIPIGQRQFYDRHESIDGRICPHTPRADEAISKRSWDKKIGDWKRELHMWDNFQNSKLSQAQINLTKQIYEKQIQRSKAIQALKEKEYIPYESRQQSMSVNQGTDRISKQKQDTQKQGTQKQGTQKQGKNELKNGRTKEEGPNWHQKERRSKQILIGKNTDGYIRYKAAIPIDQRQFYDGHQSIGGRICPQTPRADEATTKRQWDAKTQQWRRELHMWDDFENSKLSQAQIDEAKQFYKDQINRLNAIQAVKKKDSYQRYRSAVPKPSRESSVIWFPKKGEQINCPQTPKLTSTTFDGEIREWSNAIESLPQSLTIQKRQIVTKEQQEDLFRRIVNDVYAK